MRLLIVSNMSHYRRGAEIAGWGPAAQEIDHLSELFDEIRHIACLHPGTAPLSALPYSSKRVHVIPVPPAGGARLRDKLRIVRLSRLYIKSILRELPQADVVHVRCPANISLLALLLLSVVRRPARRWVKYAGSWEPYVNEPWSSRFQRWWLRRGLHRGVVSINGQWPGQPNHVYSFFNPCLTDRELIEAGAKARDKHLTSPLRLVFVGHMVKAKGVSQVLQVLALLRRRHLPAMLDLVGDGPDRLEFERLAGTLEIRDLVTFHGWRPRPALGDVYQPAHLILLPSRTEGWPKVLSEAMAYGVVPLAARVGSIEAHLREFSTGRTLDPDDVHAFVETILQYCEHPDRWKAASQNGLKAAAYFTYHYYLRAVRELLAANNDRPAPSRRLPLVSTESPAGTDVAL